MIERTSSEATAVQQDAAVQAQYKTAQNLNIRISIHAKYSTNKQGLVNWIFPIMTSQPVRRSWSSDAVPALYGNTGFPLRKTASECF